MISVICGFNNTPEVLHNLNKVFKAKSLTSSAGDGKLYCINIYLLI